jgi:transglutaminase 1
MCSLCPKEGPAPNVTILYTEDQVYLPGDELLREYVLADSGLMWHGTYNRLRPCVWKYAQFEKDILDCSLYLLSHVGKLTHVGRSDPVKTCRVLSAAVSMLLVYFYTWPI